MNELTWKPLVWYYEDTINGNSIFCTIRCNLDNVFAWLMIVDTALDMRLVSYGAEYTLELAQAAVSKHIDQALERNIDE